LHFSYIIILLIQYKAAFSARIGFFSEKKIFFDVLPLFF